ncbi:hypothetical protein BO94DRAFT_628586 [Aspergillus sclerotioniger CBS 115572]|uniref:Secreted protein n=1 Tax=Aspergillus sclerotioniger CBS 115572 TaxID=1450535 RepID=A0A317V3Y1_9EURO|nr:hypothetical protein BO94DRAFT_628586 [Aspergillus sclerotioniger CBS 115572]PWY68983.1 hypothetical protein BO94DRAFT_628586 [Aspergillus sclerotioniger CBS 115572]
MKSLHFLLPLTLYTTTALSQGIYINSPAPGSQLSAGSSITVQVARYDFIQSVAEIGLGIGFSSCTNGCPDPTASLGTLGYSGGYDPEFGPGIHDQYENFTMTVPETTGPAQIGVVRAFLVGLGYETTIGSAVANVTIV